jgi:hypothetical protein
LQVATEKRVVEAKLKLQEDTEVELKLEKEIAQRTAA